MKNSLIIFIKNPLPGKVKSRLAKDIGESEALAVYIRLLNYTKSITDQVDADKSVYYSDYIDTEDIWGNDVYNKKLQRGNDLGEKMLNAFTEQFNSGYKKVIIIGSDNAEISTGLINNAFETLTYYDIVIGPAKDGGYYLLGKKKIYHSIFKNKKWGSNSVLNETIKEIANYNLSYKLLRELNDIDTGKDWKQSLKNNLI